jgi:hypothetical protein
MDMPNQGEPAKVDQVQQNFEAIAVLLKKAWRAALLCEHTSHNDRLD